MFDSILVVLAIVIGAAGGGKAPGLRTAAPAQGAVAASDTATAAGGAGYAAEPQVPTGKFTTATEIKPIMAATRANWVAIREYEGRDLIYFTHILSWRCGMVAVRYAINDGMMQDWPLPPCQSGTSTPNAISQDAKIYEAHPLSSIRSVTVEVIYDDLSRETARFERAEVLMP